MVAFYYIDTTRRPQNATILKSFVLALFKKEGFSVGRVNYVFCNDKYLLNINRTHLKHNFFTDIITFPLSEGGQPIVADIFISTDRVFDNHISFKASFQDELRRVIFHGALHLCGHNDKTVKQKEEMRAAENKYLKMFHKYSST
ncbi:MAG TPA: rRNA maturation RNase YbeY [Chitinophagaceae bacterium]|nr:rRNA maturation RNase YbeY [Chitinophagaceae bacterium]